MRKIVKILQWILGVFLLFNGVLFMSDSLMTGLTSIAAGLVLLPPVTKRIPPFKFRKTVLCFTSIVLFLISCICLPDTSTNNISDPADSLTPPQSTTTSTTTTETTQLDSTTIPTQAPVLTEPPTQTPVLTEPPTQATEPGISKSVKKKLEKHLKKENYEDIITLFQTSNKNEQAYILEQLEQNICTNISGQQISEDNATELRELLDSFINANLTTEKLSNIHYALSCLGNYYDCLSALPPKYSGPIKQGSNIINQEVYISIRVGSALFDNVYTDYYGAYTQWETIFDERIPNYDSKMIIIYSETPLSQGFTYLTLVEDGTYTTVSNGFEETHTKYVAYSQEELNKYYTSDYNERTRTALNNAINNTIEAIDQFINGNTEKGQNLTNKAGQEYAAMKFVGEWGDEVSQRAYMDITYDGTVFQIEVRWSSSASEYSTWTMSGNYDPVINGIVYNNGVCKNVTESGESTVFTDSTGKFYMDNSGRIFWEDNKEENDQNCEFVYFDPM